MTLKAFAKAHYGYYAGVWTGTAAAVVIVFAYGADRVPWWWLLVAPPLVFVCGVVGSLLQFAREHLRQNAS